MGHSDGIQSGPENGESAGQKLDYCVDGNASESVTHSPSSGRGTIEDTTLNNDGIPRPELIGEERIAKVQEQDNSNLARATHGNAQNNQKTPESTPSKSHTAPKKHHNVSVSNETEDLRPEEIEAIEKHREEVTRRMQDCIDSDVKALTEPDLSPFVSLEDMINRLLPFNIMQHSREEECTADIESVKAECAKELADRAVKIAKKFREYTNSNKCSLDPVILRHIDSLIQNDLNNATSKDTKK